MVRPFVSKQRYLSINLEKCCQIAPDWLMVFFEIVRQVRVQELKVGDELGISSPIWKSAGVMTLDRRKKILSHLEAKVPPEVFHIKRQQGRLPVVVIGAELNRFLHS